MYKVMRILEKRQLGEGFVEESREQDGACIIYRYNVTGEQAMWGSKGYFTEWSDNDNDC